MNRRSFIGRAIAFLMAPFLPTPTFAPTLEKDVATPEFSVMMVQVEAMEVCFWNGHRCRSAEDIGLAFWMKGR